MSQVLKTAYTVAWSGLLAATLYACSGGVFGGSNDKIFAGGAAGKRPPGLTGGNPGKGSDGNDGNDGADGNDGNDSGPGGGPAGGSDSGNPGAGTSGNPGGGSDGNSGNDGKPDGGDDEGGSTGKVEGGDDGGDSDISGDDGGTSTKLTSDLTLALTKENDKGECGDNDTQITVELHSGGQIKKSQVLPCPLAGQPVVAKDFCYKNKKTCLKITFNYKNGDTVQDTWMNQTNCIFMEKIGTTAMKIGWDYNGAGFLGTCKPFEDDVIEATCSATRELSVQSCD